MSGLIGCAVNRVLDWLPVYCKSGGIARRALRNMPHPVTTETCYTTIRGSRDDSRPVIAPFTLWLKCKAMAEVTLSAKNQIVIPREARAALRLKPGDKILLVVRGERVLILKKPKSYHVAIRGLACAAYPEGHLQKERRSWDRNVIS
ncbi:MAG TPA: AbrB/MazE/SpoVT family DNA-binding domain-containing protein [Terriglobales bacterium]